MKKIILFLLTAAVAVSCGSGQKYLISGTWPDGDGQTVYLKKQLDKDTYEVIDSVTVAGGAFEMKGRVPNIDKYTVWIGKSKEEVILDDVPLAFDITTERHENRKGEMVSSNVIKITGSPEQEILREIREMSTGKSFMALGTMFALAQAKDDPRKFDSIYRETETLKTVVDDRIRNYFDSINDSYAVTYAIGDFIAREYPLEDVTRYYDNLTERIKKSYPGRLLDEKVGVLRSTGIGGQAPDIELPAPDGQIVKLSSLRGKIVLIDFWASWCGPCLREVPNVKAIYDQYRDRGFEIYGISLDKEIDRDAWLEKIEEYDMDWIQVSSLKGWDCPVAKQYNVTGIPKMFLLDGSGRIIAKDLRGEELREKVASMF